MDLETFIRSRIFSSYSQATAKGVVACHGTSRLVKLISIRIRSGEGEGGLMFKPHFVFPLLTFKSATWLWSPMVGAGMQPLQKRADHEFVSQVVATIGQLHATLRPCLRLSPQTSSTLGSLSHRFPPCRSQSRLHVGSLWRREDARRRKA